MAERKSSDKPVSDSSPVAPQGEPELQGADKVALEASLKGQAEYIEAVEKVGDVLRENKIASFNDSQTTAGAEAFVEEAKKQAEGEVKTTESGLIIGVDGVNPVSNENPDPRTINGVRL